MALAVLVSRKPDGARSDIQRLHQPLLHASWRMHYQSHLLGPAEINGEQPGLGFADCLSVPSELEQYAEFSSP